MHTRLGIASAGFGGGTSELKDWIGELQCIDRVLAHLIH